MPADRLEEHVKAGDGVLFGAVTGGLGGYPGQVAFQQRTVDIGEGVHAGCDGGEELAEPGERSDVNEHGADGQSRGQPQPSPALG